MPNCPICDRPHASMFGDDGCHAQRAEQLWRSPSSSHDAWLETRHTALEAEAECKRHAVNWRARARAAEAALAACRLSVGAMLVADALLPVLPGVEAKWNAMVAELAKPLGGLEVCVKAAEESEEA